MSWFNAFRALLPRSRPWALTLDSFRRRWFDGLTALPNDYVGYVDDVWDDINPETTRELAKWEDTLRLSDGSGLIPSSRRGRLAARWSARGGQSPGYIQRTLRAAGFDVYVHEWWDPDTGDARDPNDQIGHGLATGYLIRNDARYAETNYVTYADDTPSVYADDTPSVYADDYIDFSLPLVPLVPSTDPDEWPYYWYVGAERWGAQAIVDAARRYEFELLILQLNPKQYTVGVFADYQNFPQRPYLEPVDYQDRTLVGAYLPWVSDGGVNIDNVRSARMRTYPEGVKFAWGMNINTVGQMPELTDSGYLLTIFNEGAVNDALGEGVKFVGLAGEGLNTGADSTAVDPVTDSHTMLARFVLPSLPPAGKKYFLMGKGGGGTLASEPFNGGCYLTSDGRIAWAYFNGVGYNVTQSAAGLVTPGDRIHLAYRVDYSAGTTQGEAEVFVDGVSVCSLSNVWMTVSAPITADTFRAVDYNSDATFWTDSTPCNLVTLALDNRSWGDAEIAAEAAEVWPVQTALLPSDPGADTLGAATDARYRLYDGGGPPTIDNIISSSTAGGLTNINGAVNAPGGFGLSFNGTDQYLLSPSNHPATASTSFYYGCWVRTTTNDTVLRGVITNGVVGSVEGRSLYFYAGKLAGMVGYGATGISFPGTINIADGEWHYVELNGDYNGSDTVLEIRVDGTLDASQTIVGFAPNQTTRNIYVGAANSSQIWEGEISGALVLPRALGADDRAREYAKGVPGRLGIVPVYGRVVGTSNVEAFDGPGQRADGASSYVRAGISALNGYTEASNSTMFLTINTSRYSDGASTQGVFGSPYLMGAYMTAEDTLVVAYVTTGGTLQVTATLDDETPAHRLCIRLIYDRGTGESTLQVFEAGVLLNQASLAGYVISPGAVEFELGRFSPTPGTTYYGALDVSSPWFYLEAKDDTYIETDAARYAAIVTERGF